ncbi:hypothetical protein CROQUDRAFT_650363 [Cronartium quercuum f. sp. fusiforme G11]|uniref:Uncharacterized protein n=1 Tax=Cronartium quercuum f. sp. fusiforme G11 TaxID=708437 RepID=A0A9P6TIY9_9BASI|nr:hypothetical protein CROQUDRAFT_650363 [Cronartium quercuum f. sp. fusiforme G11]
MKSNTLSSLLKLGQCPARSPLLSSSSYSAIASASSRSTTKFTPDYQVHDLVGPPSPQSNLRPIRYAALFPPSVRNSNSDIEPCTSSIPSNLNPAHPYSLNEFNSQPDPMPSTLVELRNKLELEDLEWILLRKRIEKNNEEFWARQSTTFETLEEATRERVLASSGSASAVERRELVDTALDKFYQSWLIDEQARFKSYTFGWWKVQVRLLRGSWKAQKRVWHWQWACWKSGWHASRP